MARRRFQTGQLLKVKGKNKQDVRYYLRFREDVVENGVIKRVRRKEFLGTTLDYPTAALIKKAVEDRLRQINHESIPTTLMTFAQFVKHWKANTLPTYKAGSRAPAEGVIDNYLLPHFGAMQLKDIKQPQIQAWVTGLKNEGKLSGATITKKIYAQLRAMWRSEGGAMPLGYAHHDPFTGIKKPSVGTPETYCYSRQETEAIIARLVGQDKLIGITLAELGMRPNEIPPLKIHNVDFEGLKIHIKEAISGDEVTGPKGKGEGKKRTVIMGDFLAAALKQHLNGRTSGLVFLEDGGMVNMQSFRFRLNKVLDALGIRAKAEAMGIDRLGFYPMRHASVTSARKAKLNPKSISNQYGHSRVSTTDIYDHGDEQDYRQFLNENSFLGNDGSDNGPTIQ